MLHDLHIGREEGELVIEAAMLLVLRHTVHPQFWTNDQVEPQAATSLETIVPPVDGSSCPAGLALVSAAESLTPAEHARPVALAPCASQ